MVLGVLVPTTSCLASNCLPADRPGAADVALGGAHHNLLALAPRLCQKYSAGQRAHTAIEAGIRCCCVVLCNRLGLVSPAHSSSIVWVSHVSDLTSVYSRLQAFHTTRVRMHPVLVFADCVQVSASPLPHLLKLQRSPAFLVLLGLLHALHMHIRCRQLCCARADWRLQVCVCCHVVCPALHSTHCAPAGVADHICAVLPGDICDVPLGPGQGSLGDSAAPSWVWRAGDGPGGLPCMAVPERWSLLRAGLIIASRSMPVLKELYHAGAALSAQWASLW